MGGVILVTLGWIWSYWNMTGSQVALKLVFKTDNAQAHRVAERSLMNTLEQGIVFLTLLWLHALFVDVATTVSMGTFYVILRALYPVFYSFYGHFTVLAELSTAPNYYAIWYFAFDLFFKCIYPDAGVDSFSCMARLRCLADFAPAVQGILLFFIVLACYIVFN